MSELVTGASKGIGLAMVIQALKAGYAVAVTSRNVDRLAAQVAQAAPDQQAQFLPLEMQFEATSIQAAVAKVMARWGHLDVLVNNAGYAILGAFEEFTLAEVK